MNPRGTNPSGGQNFGQSRPTGGGHAGQAGQTGHAGQAIQGGGDAGTMHNVREAVTDAAGQIREKVSDAASHVVDRVGDAWDTTKRGMREGWDTVSDYAGTGWDEVATFVRRYPVTCCAIAFGLGILATSMFSFRTHDVARRMERSSY